jgi:hypothetical protein
VPSANLKGIVQQKLTRVKNKHKRKIFIWRWGAGHFFNFKGMPYWILAKGFAAN